jgi:hypothetical protein
LPFVQIFIFANVYELTNSPQKNAVIDASTMRGVWPKMFSYAAWPLQPGRRQLDDDGGHDRGEDQRSPDQIRDARA